MVEQDGDQRVFEAGRHHRLVGEGVFLAPYPGQALPLKAFLIIGDLVDDQYLEIWLLQRPRLDGRMQVVIGFLVFIVATAQRHRAPAIRAGRQGAGDAAGCERQVVEIAVFQQLAQMLEGGPTRKGPIHFDGRQRLQQRLRLGKAGLRFRGFLVAEPNQGFAGLAQGAPAVLAQLHGTIVVAQGRFRPLHRIHSMPSRISDIRAGPRPKDLLRDQRVVGFGAYCKFCLARRPDTDAGDLETADSCRRRSPGRRSENPIRGRGSSSAPGPSP